MTDEIYSATEQVPPVEKYYKVLHEAATRIQTVIDDSSLNPDHNTVQISLLDLRAYFGVHFTFWAAILPKGLNYPELNNKPAGVIKDIAILHFSQVKGIGTKVIDTWERVLAQNGIEYAIATNINGSDAQEFWQKRGYLAPQEETWKRTPYCMYKILSPQEHSIAEVGAGG